MEIMILRSIINFDPEKNGWQVKNTKEKLICHFWFFSKMPVNSAIRVLSMDVLKEASELGVNLYEGHLKYIVV